MDEWRTNTPDGRTVIAMRGKDAWIVRCGTAQAQSPVLDVALIEAIRADAEVVTHSSEVDFGEWTRAEADRIQEEFERRP
jgi:hypothetical protein